MIKIDFDNTFDFIDFGDNLSFVTFKSILHNGSELEIKVKINSINDPLLPNVYNLSFGPLNPKGNIDDEIKIKHSNTSKVFSTILLYALTYIKVNPKITIGIDGSNDARAYLYHRMFISNKDYLSEYFITIGVDWYVRLLRKGNDVERDEKGIPIFKPKPESFDYKRKHVDLYRYYMFYGKLDYQQQIP